MAKRDPRRSHQPPDIRRQAGRVRWRRRWVTQRPRAILRRVRCAVGSASGQLCGRRSLAVPDEGAHLVEAGVDEVLGLIDQPRRRGPAPAGKGRPPHQPGRPDVAEDAALITQPVCQPRLAQQLVELGAVLLGHLAAHAGDAVVDLPRIVVPPVHGDPDRAQQHVGQLQRIGPAMSKPSSSRYPTRSRYPDTAAPVSPSIARSASSTWPGSPSDSSSARACSSPSNAAISRSSSLGCARRDRSSAPHQAEKLSRWQARPVPDVSQEISGRHNRRGGEPHVLRNHRRVVVATAGQIIDQLRA